MARVVAESRPPETRTTARWEAMVMLSCDAALGAAASHGAARLLPGHVAPEILMQLDLQAHRQPVRENPVGELPRRELLVARGEEHRAAAFKTELPHLRHAPLVVGPVADHEFHEILCVQPGKLVIAIARLLSRPRSLDINDPHDTLIDSLERHGAARLERDATARIAKLSQQRETALLRQGVATRDAYVTSTQLPYPLHHGLDLPPFAEGEGVLRVTVLTAQRTAREAHEYRGNPGSVGLTLQGIEDLADLESRHPAPVTVPRAAAAAPAPGWRRPCPGTG